MSPPRTEVVETSYLGYPLHVSETRVVVFTPNLRKITDVASLKQARLVVRGYRRAAK